MAEITDPDASSDSTLDSLLHTWEFTSSEHNDRKKEIFRYAREKCPVARTEEGGGFWLVTRYDDVKAVLEDWETFSSVRAPIIPTPINLGPHTEDPPFQSALRHLLNPLFSRTAVTRFEPGMRETARGLIAGWTGRGSVELIGEYSTPYTSANLAQAVFPGFGPDELSRGGEIALRIANDPSPQVFVDLLQLCTEYLTAVRETGIAGDGVIRTLMDATVDGGSIPEDKLVGVLCILVLGGLETTRGAIGNIAYRVATTPGLEDRLRDPDWTRGDLDEFLRLDTPITCIARVATRDTELNGVPIKAGERVQIRYDSANWDEDRFPGADRLVFDAERGGNAAFGLGVHRCVGVHLARLQIKVAFEELLAKITNLRLAPDADITWAPGNATHLHTLSLEFDRALSQGACPVKYVIGIDVGGTFTDAVAADELGAVVGAKTPSTPEDYSAGVLGAVGALAAQLGIAERELLESTSYIAHGTTASINALVTGNVEPAGFITTKGHGDSIAIMNVEGRYLGLSALETQDILNTRKPAPLVPRSRVEEVTERVDYTGAVVVPLNEDEVRGAVTRLAASGVRAIAVSLLWSFQNPAHERRVREIIHDVDPEIFTALSSDVSPRIREYARNATTIMSTQLGPPLRRYLEPLEHQLAERGLDGPLLIMQGSGGTISAGEAPGSAITTVGSVLSGGVVGASQLARQLGHRDVVTADVGGTTFLVGMIVGGEPVRSPSTIINQTPVNVPTVKVTAIGSGGGAIAWIDQGGNLRVGPDSAAAVPGPAAYDAGGTRPTVTDAAVVLGIINPDYFLGGRRKLRADLAAGALLEHVGRPLGLTAEQAAAAVQEVQNAQTADLTRKVVIESGHDPREFTVYAFGGAGPIHASAFAAELGAAELVVPLGAAASGFSAYGLAASDVVINAELSDPAPFPLDPGAVAANFRRLEQQVRDTLARQGVEYASVELRRSFDARYTPQMFEVTAPAPDGAIDTGAVGLMAKAFEQRYAELYGEGSGFAGAGIQLITYRVRGTGRLSFHPALSAHPSADSEDPSAAVKQRRRVFLQVERGFEDTDIYDYQLLRAGHIVPGPAIIEVPTTTVTVPAGREARVDELGNIRVNLG